MVLALDMKETRVRASYILPLWLQRASETRQHMPESPCVKAPCVEL